MGGPQDIPEPQVSDLCPTLSLAGQPGQHAQGILQAPELPGGELQLLEGSLGQEGRQDGARGLLDAQVPQVDLGKQAPTATLSWYLRGVNNTGKYCRQK